MSGILLIPTAFIMKNRTTIVLAATLSLAGGESHNDKYWRETDRGATISLMTLSSISKPDL